MISASFLSIGWIWKKEDFLWMKNSKATWIVRPE